MRLSHAKRREHVHMRHNPGDAHLSRIISSASKT
jgi:hypothetical protein